MRSWVFNIRDKAVRQLIVAVAVNATFVVFVDTATASRLVRAEIHIATRLVLLYLLTGHWEGNGMRDFEDSLGWTVLLCWECHLSLCRRGSRLKDASASLYVRLCRGLRRVHTTSKTHVLISKYTRHLLSRRL
jgi:hypothetical protein